MPQLVIHQLRVASVAMTVCDSLDITVDEDSIIKACLFHDMGNIIKFQLDKFPEWNEPEGTEYWKKVKDECILKYGDNEHKASLMIGKEIGLSSKILELINGMDSKLMGKIYNSNDFDLKICKYADLRVAPRSIVSINERMDEAKKRYEGHKNKFNKQERKLFRENIIKIEKQIFPYSKIKPEDINDKYIQKNLEFLKDFEI